MSKCTGILHWKAQGLKILPGLCRWTICSNKMKRRFQIVSIQYLSIAYMNTKETLIWWYDFSIDLFFIQIFSIFFVIISYAIIKFLSRYYERCEVWTMIWSCNMGRFGSFNWNIKLFLRYFILIYNGFFFFCLEYINSSPVLQELESSYMFLEQKIKNYETWSEISGKWSLKSKPRLCNKYFLLLISLCAQCWAWLKGMMHMGFTQTLGLYKIHLYFNVYKI